MKKFIILILSLCVCFPVFAATLNSTLAPTPSPTSTPSKTSSPSAVPTESVSPTESISPTESVEPAIEDVIAEVPLFNINAKSYLLMEAETGTVLYKNNENEKLPIASVTKIMTALLTAEAIERGELTLDTQIITSENAASMGGSQVYLEPNEKMSLRDMLKALMVASANDAAVAIAEKIAGTEGAFVGKMNARAKELGMKNTNFLTSNGLDKEKQDGLSTSYDVALMSQELLKYDYIIKDSQIWMDTLRNGAFGISNTNKLLKQYEGTIGLKTGSTATAKYCLSAVAKRNDITYIAVVLGAETPKDRWDGSKQLLDYGFNNYEKYESKIDINTKVDKGVKREAEFEIEGGGACVISKADKSNIRVETDIPKSVSAPIEKGQKVGSVKFYVGEKMLKESNIIATEDVAKLNIWGGIKYIFEQLFTLEREK